MELLLLLLLGMSNSQDASFFHTAPCRCPMLYKHVSGAYSSLAGGAPRDARGGRAGQALLGGECAYVNCR